MNNQPFDVGRDDVVKLLATIRALSGYLEGVLDDGVPRRLPKRASVDAVSADMEWWEERRYAIKDADEVLKDWEGRV